MSQGDTLFAEIRERNARIAELEDILRCGMPRLGRCALPSTERRGRCYLSMI